MYIHYPVFLIVMISNLSEQGAQPTVLSKYTIRKVEVKCLKNKVLKI